jgi:hypothetical protein
MVGGWVWDLANARGGPSIFFGRPLGYYIDKQGPRAHVEPAFAVPRSRARTAHSGLGAGGIFLAIFLGAFSKKFGAFFAFLVFLSLGFEFHLLLC